LDEWFDERYPQPALSHGDLRSGNVGFTGDGEPVIFGPAVYYDDRGSESGIIEMFGGLDTDLQRAYERVNPFSTGFNRRKYLCLPYHRLNHCRLFVGWLSC